jgi:PleD family two-component response regulator
MQGLSKSEVIPVDLDPDGKNGENGENGEILIVDDHFESLQLLSDLLTEHAYVVRRVIRGDRVLEAVLNHPPDLILLDILMPNITGFEICRDLKANPKTQEIPIIFLSALDGKLDKVKAFTMGGRTTLPNPLKWRRSSPVLKTNSKLSIYNANLGSETTF